MVNKSSPKSCEKHSLSHTHLLSHLANATYVSCVPLSTGLFMTTGSFATWNKGLCSHRNCKTVLSSSGITFPTASPEPWERQFRTGEKFISFKNNSHAFQTEKNKVSKVNVLNRRGWGFFSFFSAGKIISICLLICIDPYKMLKLK